MFHVKHPMKNYTNCPICKESKFHITLTCKDYTVSKKEFNITQCNSCGFEFTNPIPLESEIGSYYESEEYISHSNTSKGLINKLYQTVRSQTLKEKINILKNLSSKRELLDIGSGTGEFLNEANKSNYNTIGIEPSKKARDNSIKNYNLNVSEEPYLKELKDNSFDFITMWHVLEHVYHLNDRVKEIYRLLSNGGFAIIAVPNCESYDAKKYKEYWAAYDLPRHLYHFKQKDITSLFKQNGFEYVKTLPMRFDSYYVSMLSEKYKNNSLGLIKAFYNGFISNLKASAGGTPGYSSQIYIFRKTEK